MDEMKGMHEAQMLSLNEIKGSMVSLEGRMESVEQYVQFQGTQIRHINTNLDDYRNSKNVPLYFEPFLIYRPPPPSG